MFAVFQSGELVKITLRERERGRELCSTSITLTFVFIFVSSNYIYQISLEETVEQQRSLGQCHLGNDDEKNLRRIVRLKCYFILIKCIIVFTREPKYCLSHPIGQL